TDLGQTQAVLTYDYAGRLTSATYPSVYSGTISSSYGLDGLLRTRSWPNAGETATLSYDGAKRPLSATYSVAGSLSQTYDRAGNVKSEARSLSGVSGDAGTGTQTFNYDRLNRVSSASGLSTSSSYAYDLDSNRTQASSLGVLT